MIGRYSLVARMVRGPSVIFLVTKEFVLVRDLRRHFRLLTEQLRYMDGLYGGTVNPSILGQHVSLHKQYALDREFISSNGGLNRPSRPRCLGGDFVLHWTHSSERWWCELDSLVRIRIASRTLE